MTGEVRQTPASAPIPRCSDLASSTSFIGTAPTASRWWLIEDPGPWGTQAVRDAEQPWIAAGAGLPQGHARVVLVRRHAGFHDRRSHTSRRIFTFAPGEAVVWSRLVGDDQDPGMVNFDAAPTGPAWAPADDYPRVIVCTNGRRDRCCAERGRATLDSLSPDVLEQVWECTHLGGHRFAPVALAIPSGAVLGRVTRDCLIDIVRHHRFDLDTLRGRSDLSPPEQVGEISARRAWGWHSTRDHLSVSSEGHNDGPDVTVVVRRPDNAMYRVTVSQRLSEPVIVSCAGTPEPVTMWEEAL